MMQSRNSVVLCSFINYCIEHPQERFWQALRNWSGYPFVLVGSCKDAHNLDTFYWEGRDHEQA